MHGSEGFDVVASVVAYRTPLQQLELLLAPLSECANRLRIIVVNNSPSDKLSAITNQRDVVYVNPEKNLGFGAGHNVALKATLNSAKYHLVMNPDVTFDADVIGNLYRFMEERPDVGMVMPRILYPDGSEQRLCKLLPLPFDLFLRRFLGPAGKALFRGHWDQYELRDLDMNVIREVPNLSGCFMFMRTSVLREVGLFDERYFMYMEDVDLCRRIGRVSRTVFYPHVSITHGYAKGSYQNVKLLAYHVTSAVKYFSKWGWFYDPERTQLNRKIGELETENIPSL
jgi:GT2 family glycosyltransferase